MERVADAMTKLVNNNTFINVVLVSCFGALSYRSLEQQKDILALEAEKESIAKANKAIKKTIWEWKQQLYSEAEAAAQNALVPLPKLKAIYGEATTPTASALPAGGAQNGDGNSPAPKLII